MAVAITYQSNNNDTTNTTAYTFTGQSLGAAAGDRDIVVAIGARNNATGVVSSVTIGGVSATLLKAIDDTNAGSDLVELWIAAVPTGTTGDIVVNFTGTMLRCAIIVWSMTGASSITPSATASDSGTIANGGVYSAALTIPSNGGGIAAAWGGGGGNPIMLIDWAVFSEDAEINPESPSNVLGGAHGATSGTITATISASSTNIDGGIVAAAFNSAVNSFDMCSQGMCILP